MTFGHLFFDSLSWGFLQWNMKPRPQLGFQCDGLVPMTGFKKRMKQ